MGPKRPMGPPQARGQGPPRGPWESTGPLAAPKPLVCPAGLPQWGCCVQIFCLLESNNPRSVPGTCPRRVFMFNFLVFAFKTNPTPPSHKTWRFGWGGLRPHPDTSKVGCLPAASGAQGPPGVPPYPWGPQRAPWEPQGAPSDPQGPPREPQGSQGSLLRPPGASWGRHTK